MRACLYNSPGTHIRFPSVREYACMSVHIQFCFIVLVLSVYVADRCH